MLSAQNPFGIFEQSTTSARSSTATEFDAATQSNWLSGAGANIWFKKDELHFASKQVKGNVILQCR